MSHSSEKPGEDMYPELLAMNARAFAAGNYSVAFHLLAAALDAVEQQPHAERFQAIQERAWEQLAEIDRVAPQYQHSTASAKARGHHSIFTMLAEQAHGRRVIQHGKSLIARSEKREAGP
jgi:hypothetical protein